MVQISGIPPELLEEIFLNVCRDADGHTVGKTSKEWTTSRTFTPNYRSPVGPYSISHVNRQWRDLVLNLPQLWTHLRIIEPQKDSITKLAEEWIGRSGSLPVCLSLHSRQKFSTETATKAVLAFYFDMIHRCLSFELDILNLDQLLGIRWPKRHHFKFVKIRILSRPFGREDWDFFPGFFLSTDTLSSVIWDVAPRSLCISSFSQPWANLTELGLLRLTSQMPQWTSVLPKCRNLERLVLSLNSTRMPGIIKRTTMPRLTFLSVKSDYHSRGTLFTLLIVPSLLELEIITASCVDFKAIEDMLERSESTLEKLKLTVNEHSEEEFNESAFAKALTAQCFQGLRELEGRAHSWTDTRDILKTRVVEDAAETLSTVSRSKCRYLPNLEKLSLIEYDERDLE